MSISALPLVYSCSGCSSAGQMANYLALRLDRTGMAEMSCIAGVGGQVRKMIRIASSGRPIIAIDGCALHCVENSLAQRQISPDLHIRLQSLGVKKQYGADFDSAEADQILKTVILQAGELSRTS